MVLTAYFVLAPETGFVVSVFGIDAGASMPEISASGYQAHTTSPSASCAIRQRHQSVHHIPRPTFVTIAKRPS
jgi:hypothetical protein